MTKTWREIIYTVGFWPLIIVAGYAAVAFGIFAIGMNDLPRAMESSVYSLLMLFVWLLLIGYHTQASNPAKPSETDPVFDVQHPRAETMVLLAILVVIAVLAAWVWLGPTHLRWPSWAVALAISYALPLVFLRIGGFGPSHVGLDLRGNWKIYLLVIVSQMLLAQGVNLILPSGLWRRDLVAGVLALAIVLGLFGVLASPLMGRWRVDLSGIWEDVRSLEPFTGLLALLVVSQVVGSILLVGDAGVLTRPLYPLNGYFAQGPVSEEIFYRGLLQTRLQALFLSFWPTGRPLGWSILLTGIAFTAMHIPSHIASGANLTVELLDFTGGFANVFAAGYFYYRTRNLVPVVIFHSLSFL